eukprot:8394006-Alexandrium_andersonii.AAC.1
MPLHAGVRKGRPAKNLKQPSRLLDCCACAAKVTPPELTCERPWTCGYPGLSTAAPASNQPLPLPL